MEGPTGSTEGTPGQAGGGRVSEQRVAAMLGEAVLDALPSPTVLVDADGTVLLTNSAWSTATESLGPGRTTVRVGDNYFQKALSFRDDEATRSVLEELHRLARGERTLVSIDYAVPRTGGSRWLHLQASRVDETGRVVITHTDITARIRA